MMSSQVGIACSVEQSLDCRPITKFIAFQAQIRQSNL